tara:strand:+ start:986 stop:1876 length:891 start_codon:yes stop_codon:yes gene_type:complete
MSGKYAEFFDTEEYSFGTSIDSIAANQSNLINQLEAQDPRRQFFRFGDDAPTLTELLENPEYMNRVLDPMLYKSLIVDDKGLFGGEGYGVPKDYQDFKSDLLDYYGENLSRQERLQRFYEDIGEEYTPTGNTGQDTLDAFNKFFKDNETSLKTSYKLIGKRIGGNLNPYADAVTFVDGIENRMGTIKGLESEFDTSQKNLEIAGETYGGIKKQSKLYSSSTGIAESGVANTMLDNLEKNYMEEIQGLRENRALSWSNIASAMKGFRTADEQEVRGFYSTIDTALDEQDLDFTTEIG